MIREERDPQWWTEVASHPAVRETLFGMDPAQIGALVAHPQMTPLASDNGGYLFARMDGFGFVAEVHSLFTPAGWGREVVKAGLEALQWVFDAGYQAVTTYEVDGNARSKPPRRCGFVRAGEWRETPFGRFRLWILTKAAWESSPVWRPKCPLQ